MSPRRRRLGIVVALLLGLPIVAAVLAYVWVNRVADQRWAAAEERMRQLAAAYPEPGFELAVAATEAAKDNQIHFIAAIRMAAPKPLETKEEAAKLFATRKRGEPLESLLDDSQDFLDRLHAGGRRIGASPADFPPRWSGDWDPGTLLHMMNCGVLRARQQRLGKRPFEAAETLMDLMQLGRFWAISGRSHNRSRAMDVILRPLEELRDLLSFESLTSDEYRSLEREVESLEAALHSPILDLDPVLGRWAETLAQSEAKATGIWARVFPARFFKAEAFEFLCRSVERLQQANQEGYSEVRSICRKIFDEGHASRNLLLRDYAGIGYQLGWSELERKAELGLLRAAAHYRATGEVPRLPDPFGTVLLHGEDGDQIKIWSLGYHGQDAQGRPSDAWTEISFIPGVPDRLIPGNVVIKVPRRQ